MEHYGDNFIPVVPSDSLGHDTDTPFAGMMAVLVERIRTPLTL